MHMKSAKRAVAVVWLMAALGWIAASNGKQGETMRTYTVTIELAEAQHSAILAEALKAARYSHNTWNASDEIQFIAQMAVENRANRLMEKYADEAEAAFPPGQSEIQITVTSAHREITDVKPPTLSDDPAGEPGADATTGMFVQNTEKITDHQTEKNPTIDARDLLMRCVQSEAGNQPVEGRQAVAEVIMNRVADPRFPDTITGVIMAPGQFTVVTTGTINNAVPDDITIAAVEATLSGARVLPEGYVYFNTSPIGNDVTQIKDHYFGR